MYSGGYWKSEVKGHTHPLSRVKRETSAILGDRLPTASCVPILIAAMCVTLCRLMNNLRPKCSPETRFNSPPHKKLKTLKKT